MGHADIGFYFYTREQVVIPRSFSGVYGSAMLWFTVAQNTAHEEKFYIHKNKIKHINREEKRCSEDADSESLGRCIVQSMENVGNCTYGHALSDRNLQSCNIKQATYLSSKIEIMKDMSEDEIYNLTGCIPFCERDEIHLESSGDFDKEIYPYNNARLRVTFVFKDGSYQEIEEYIVYDTGSFIADVGGYLGLLLGYSLLSIYQDITKWIMSSKIWKIKL